MSALAGKRIVITGASAGIGAACARRLAADGADVILWARRIDRLAELADAIEAAHGRRVHVAAVDVRDRHAVEAAAAPLLEDDHVPHALVNNAGLAAGFDLIHEGDPDDWDRMIDTNIKGLLYATRALLPAMIRAGRGHIVNIGSIAGHLSYPRGNVYAATKYAVRGLTEGINLDVAGTPIRVSNVEPGLAETEFSTVRFQGDAERAKNVYAGIEALTGDDVADAVSFVLSRPPHVNVFQLILMPTAQRNVYVTTRDEG